MLGRELEGRANKLVRESKERAEKARRHAEKEKILKARQDERLRQHEEQQQQQRLAAAAAVEAERLKHEEALETNNGVWWQETLQAMPLPVNAAEQLGIKRSTDKVNVIQPLNSPNAATPERRPAYTSIPKKRTVHIVYALQIRLPKPAGDFLMSQDAPKNGAMMFEVATPAGRSVHAGVLDFSAAPGTVALPEHLIRNLWGLTTGDGQCQSDVTVTYRRLPKGTYVRFQPRSADFQTALGSGMELALQASMFTHSTLTEGEWVQITHEGASHDVKVLALQPESAVSVIDTDLEAEVDPSVETEEKLQAEEQAARQRLEAMQKLQEDNIREALQAATLQQQAQADAEKIRQEKELALPPEPSGNAEPVVTCLFRMPDGTRASRKFLQSQRAHMLFDFADSKGAGGLPVGAYQLVTQFPRRVIAVIDTQDKSLADLGFAAQEVLLLERLATADN